MTYADIFGLTMDLGLKEKAMFVKFVMIYALGVCAERGFLIKD